GRPADGDQARGLLAADGYVEGQAGPGRPGREGHHAVALQERRRAGGPGKQETGSMKHMRLAQPGERLSVLCIGAHSDDIEIGAGATILGWIEQDIELDVHWVVLSATGNRGAEAFESATSFLKDAHSAKIEIGAFQDGFFPYQGADIKAWFEKLRPQISP